MSGRSGVSRWLASTSNRTFIVWPVVLVALEGVLQGGLPRIEWWALPVLAWGYLQYRLVGDYRARIGGGGPGISIPPDRIVETGPYRYVRNPMYLGHLIFFAGLAAALRSPVAWAVFAFHAFWFDRRAREDEARLVLLFGDAYLDYCRRVKRWIPGVY
ncbi:MAG TPA: isoprenylcysteine carboxylmethyltransferase family protein [Usitatibacter sp.]|nr:isoprenylcysteine carboxylmethyltransferase family protein [Usitatibacter sp.]